MTMLITNIILITFMVITAMVITTIAVSPEPDYYWRDYDGTIPSDALIASDDQVRYTYIGSGGIFDGGLYVAQLYPPNPNITVTGKPSTNDYNGVHVVDKFVKILCTEHPEMFQWYTVTNSTFDSVPFHRVLGGWERSEDGTLFIGRTLENGLVTVGKVIGYDDGSGPWLYILDVDHESVPIHRYELLVYLIPRDN